MWLFDASTSPVIFFPCKVYSIWLYSDNNRYCLDWGGIAVTFAFRSNSSLRRYRQSTLPDRNSTKGGDFTMRFATSIFLCSAAIFGFVTAGFQELAIQLPQCGVSIPTSLVKEKHLLTHDVVIMFRNRNITVSMRHQQRDMYMYRRSFNRFCHCLPDEVLYSEGTVQSC